jgi:PAS domain-containing protein
VSGIHLAVLLRRSRFAANRASTGEPVTGRIGRILVVTYAAQLPEGTCVYVSRSVELLTGSPASELVGLERPWLRSAFPSDRRRVDEDFAAWRAGSMERTFRARYRLRAPGFQTLWVDESVVAARAPGGRPVALRGRLVVSASAVDDAPPGSF